MIRKLVYQFLILKMCLNKFISQFVMPSLIPGTKILVLLWSLGVIRSRNHDISS